MKDAYKSYRVPWILMSFNSMLKPTAIAKFLYVPSRYYILYTKLYSNYTYSNLVKCKTHFRTASLETKNLKKASG
jgi:hypothetical protein